MIWYLFTDLLAPSGRTIGQSACKNGKKILPRMERSMILYQVVLRWSICISYHCKRSETLYTISWIRRITRTSFDGTLWKTKLILLLLYKSLIKLQTTREPQAGDYTNINMQIHMQLVIWSDLWINWLAKTVLHYVFTKLRVIIGKPNNSLMRGNIVIFTTKVETSDCWRGYVFA